MQSTEMRHENVLRGTLDANGQVTSSTSFSRQLLITVESGWLLNCCLTNVYMSVFMQPTEVNYERALRCTTAANGLVIRCEGMNRASDGKYTAWFGIEFPRVWNTWDRAGSISVLVCSEPRETEGEAVEVAAFKAIRRIVANGIIVVIDGTIAGPTGGGVCLPTAANIWQ